MSGLRVRVYPLGVACYTFGVLLRVEIHIPDT